MLIQTKRNLVTILLVATLVITFSCEQKREATPMDLSQISLIPKPVSLEATGSSFLLGENAVIYYKNDQEQLLQEANYLAEMLRPATGFALPVQTIDKDPEAGNIYLTLTSKDSHVSNEAYKLQITEELLKVSASKQSGIFRAIQTIRQLLPASIELSEKQEQTWEIASGTIMDYPEYEYRGAMLDVSRHFFDVADVKTFIDHIAAYKMNVLHLHLSDDQGWRIEIKSWPNLTEHGGQTEVGGTPGGFYTQEQYADIVSYAKERHIMIIPEIDMPGHTNAALASYAELNCDEKARELYTGTEVGFSSLCTDKEITYKFIDDVIRELAAMTPGPYIHIGGDESHSTELKDYIYFIDRVQDIVYKHGKQMIGWDEVRHAKLKPTSVAQFWADAENALGAIEQNAMVIMSPAKKAYLDMQYDSITPLGLHWAAYIEVDEGYNWDPVNYVDGIKREHILGVEAPLWSETVKTMDDIEYMVFPRLPGYAEIGWTSGELRNWDDYKVRLAGQKERFKALKINYYPSVKVPWAEDSVTNEN
jgi:hexosaminidase